MANNNQNYMYTNVPTVQMTRSRQNLSKHYKGTTNMGDLRPFYFQEIYPGDTFKCKTNFQCRLANSLSRPLLDNMFIDTAYFFVPHRLVYDKWKELMGENNESSWIPEQTYEFPVSDQYGKVVVGSLADSFGLPLSFANDEQVIQSTLSKGVQIALFRAFALIYNEYWRDQNIIDPVYVHKGAIASSEVINDQPWGPNNYTGMPPKAGKLKDRFTSALPSPQKGDPVLVTLGGYLPLDTLDEAYTFSNGGYLQYKIPNIGNNKYNLYASGTSVDDVADVVAGSTDSSGAYNGYVKGTNLAVDISQAEGISVNDLRLAFATQRLLERSATYGTRYREILKSAFGVNSPDASLQIPEFLAGKRDQLNVSEVWQTSSNQSFTVSGLDNVLGSSAAYSKTNSSNGFTKSFTEHGYVIGVYTIRQHHNYAQGIEKFWTRKDRLDFYDPVFANIGFQPILQSELYSNGIMDLNDAGENRVFGYTEAWYDLRTGVNTTTGYLRPNPVNGAGLDVFTLTDDYLEAPTLSQEFIEETPSYLDRALSVPSEYHHQFLLDFYHTVSAIRVLPVRSTPTDLGGAHR